MCVVRLHVGCSLLTFCWPGISREGFPSRGTCAVFGADFSLGSALAHLLGLSAPLGQGFLHPVARAIHPSWGGFCVLLLGLSTPLGGGSAFCC